MTTYLDDNFNGTTGTLLSAHAPDVVGSTWAILLTGTGGATNALSGDGHVRANKTSGTPNIYGTPSNISSADLDLSIDLNIKTLLATDQLFWWIRSDATAANGYLLQINQAGAIAFSKFVTGAATSLMTATVTMTAGTLHTLRLLAVVNQFTVYWDGTALTALTGANPVSDSTFASAGKLAQRVGASTTTAQADATGIQVSRILVVDAVPTNTVAPVVSGTRVQGFTLSTTNGTWTASPSSYAYQWKRDGTNISAATSSTYTLQAADVGTNITCSVTASNASGAGTAASSNSVLIVAVMVAGDVQWLAGGASGLGGAPGATITDPRSVFDDVLASEASPGDTEYRLVYFKNAHTVQQLSGAVSWIVTNTSSPDTTLAIGVATEAVNSNVSAIADEQTAPAGVTFGAPTNNGTGFALGDIPAAQFKGLWLRRTVSASAAATGTDAVTLGWQGTPT